MSSSSSASAKSLMRARMKKRAGASNTNSSSLSSSSSASAVGAQNACDHPAVVGNLCVVCGVDTRMVGTNNNKTNVSSTNSTSSSGEWLSTNRNKKQQSKEPMHVPRKVPRKTDVENNNSRQQQILDKQKNIANSLANAAELDAEMAAVDMNSLTTNNSSSFTIPKKKANVAPPVAPVKKAATVAAKPTTGSRSLSSLLSGAAATQKMQQIHGGSAKGSSMLNNNPRSVPRQHNNKYASNQPMFNSSLSDPNMTQMTVSGGVTVTISEAEAKSISAASAKKLTEEKKLCLVLDLDHTLLHATDDYRASKFVADELIVQEEGHDDDEKKIDDHTRRVKTMKNDLKKDDVRTILLPMELPPDQQQQYAQQKLQQQGQSNIKPYEMDPLPLQNKNNNSIIIMRHYIKLRPHLKEFFTQIQSTYQLSVYTAGTRGYAEQVAIMICRHLVGAALDEEGLNTLRGKLRVKDDECRRYQARVAREKQLELAKQRDKEKELEESNKTDNSSKETKGVKKKSVRFGTTSSDDNSKNEDEARKETIDLIAIDDSDDDANDSGEHSSSSLLSSGKRRAGDDMQVPPKKKKSVNFGNLPPSDDPSSNDASNTQQQNCSGSKLVDPTEERDRLRTQLKEAENLEIKAVELRRRMFGSRIVSRTDVGDLGKDVKSLKRVFPCGGVMAAIVDDREDVWANAKNNVTGRPGEPPDNLLLVKPYHWKPFSGYADVNNASGQDLSTRDNAKESGDHDDADDDQMLLWTADVLRRLHERYYSTSSSVEKSVPDLLRAMRRETLRRHPRAKLVFSGLIPIHKQNKQNQIRPPIVRYAEELGAEVLPDVARGVTHVVAARDGSEKIRRARKECPSCYVVHTAWLMECYWSITRRDESPHHMGPLPKQSTKPPLLLHGHDEESDVDEMEEEDDFAAALENDMMNS
jgi:RNA polymerase II subunit A-like phosphatase